MLCWFKSRQKIITTRLRRPLARLQGPIGRCPSRMCAGGPNAVDGPRDLENQAFFFGFNLLLQEVARHAE